jgi:predicted RNA-binding protein with PIN domain
LQKALIDGYNVIGIYHKDLEKQRKILIESLIEYRKNKGHEITVVFDGWKTGGVLENHSFIGGIKVVYSRLGEKADSVIKRIISAERREWIVITSDRDVVSYAWSSGSIPIPSGDFLNAIEKRHMEKTHGYEDKDDYYDNDDHEEYRDIGRKGNPKKLSKKDRAIKKALSKL